MRVLAKRAFFSNAKMLVSLTKSSSREINLVTVCLTWRSRGVGFCFCWPWRGSPAAGGARTGRTQSLSRADFRSWSEEAPPAFGPSPSPAACGSWAAPPAACHAPRRRCPRSSTAPASSVRRRCCKSAGRAASTACTRRDPRHLQTLSASSTEASAQNLFRLSAKTINLKKLEQFKFLKLETSKIAQNGFLIILSSKYCHL